VVKPIAIGMNASMKPTAANAPVTAIATRAVTSQDMIASRPDRSQNSPRSSS
jgi:hypothetical protein